MNKMQNLAKTLITLTCIYWLVMIVVQLIAQSVMILMQFGRNERGFSTWAGLMITQLIGLVAILIIMQILYKREKIAAKIASPESLPQQNIENQPQIEWVSFSYRLTVFIAGLYCMFKCAVYLGNLVNRTVVMIANKMSHSDTTFTGHVFTAYNGIFVIVLLLAASIYLLRGAPHLVKWQTKKTLALMAR